MILSTSTAPPKYRTWCLLMTLSATTLDCQEQADEPATPEAAGSAGAPPAGSGSSGGTAVGGSSSTSGGGGEKAEGSAGGVDTGAGGSGALESGGLSGSSAAVAGRPSDGGGTAGLGGMPSQGGAGTGGGTAGTAGSAGQGVGGAVSGRIRSGVAWLDDTGKAVNAHGGGVIQVGDTFYLHGMYITYSATASTNENKTFKAFSMYSSRDLATWKFERLILPAQASGELGPNRIGERPHIIKCPSTGEFVLYAHAASLDYQTDKEVVYATSPTVNGVYSYRGALKNAAGKIAEHSDMSAYVDSDGVPYVLTESGHVYELAKDCHSWLTDTSHSAMGGAESPTVFKAGSLYYWLMSEKTGWRANDNTYATASSMKGPWTKQGLIAPAGEKTWLSQSTWVLPVTGSKGTVYVFWGDRWDGTESTDHPGRNNTLATHVVQPIVINGGKMSMPTFYATWQLDVSGGTWAP